MYVLCYYDIDDVTLFTLKMELDGNNINDNLWNLLKDIRCCGKLIISFELQLESCSVLKLLRPSHFPFYANLVTGCHTQ